MKTNPKANGGDCPHCKPPRTRCPYCDPDYPWPDPWRESQCVLNKPLMVVIPPEGHHIFGPGIIWCDSGRADTAGRIIEYDSTQQFVEYDSTRSPGSTYTGDTIRDTCKIL